MSNFTKLHLTHESFRILPVFSQFLWNFTFIFSVSRKKFSFNWVYYRWLITSLALEKCKKQCNMLYIILVQSFRPLKIKITQFPGRFRLNVGDVRWRLSVYELRNRNNIITLFLYLAVLGSNNDNRKGNSNSDSSTDKMVMIMAMMMIMIIIMLIKIINDNHNDNDNDNVDHNNNNILPGFLKTGLAKISTHSTAWQFKTIKLIQRPIKSLYLTTGSKLMIPRGIPTSPNSKWLKF